MAGIRTEFGDSDLQQIKFAVHIHISNVTLVIASVSDASALFYLRLVLIL